jgi:hypothetical protein
VYAAAPERADARSEIATNDFMVIEDAKYLE